MIITLLSEYTFAFKFIENTLEIWYTVHKEELQSYYTQQTMSEGLLTPKVFATASRCPSSTNVTQTASYLYFTHSIDQNSYSKLPHFKDNI